MSLRPAQQTLLGYINQIKRGEPIKDIICFWSVGSGKSTIPVLLSDLIDSPDKKIVWVCPRDSLKFQAEETFSSEIYPTNKKIRVADNIGDPFRGVDACSVTYQAIIANPEKWIELFKKYKIILFLDEYHHLSEHGSWIEIIGTLHELSILRVKGSGTIDRGDQTKIPFTRYKNNKLDMTDTLSEKWIVYNHQQSIADGHSVPFIAKLIQGSGEYIDLTGIKRRFDRFTGKGDELRTAFSTGYAYALLDLAIKKWKEIIIDQSYSKLLVVAPDIETAKEYTHYLKDFNIQSEIATSEDQKGSKEAIRRFKLSNILPDSLHVLVTVGQAYEGLNAPPVTVMAIMTLIRSVPWLFQCIGRSTRAYLDKKESYIFAPDDPKMRYALKCINGGVILDADGNPPPRSNGDNSGEGGTPQKIEALSSEAHIPWDGLSLKAKDKDPRTQSEIENDLRKSINSKVSSIVMQHSAGARKVKERLIWLRIKQIVNNGIGESGIIRKKLGEMTIPELEKVKKHLDDTYRY